MYSRRQVLSWAFYDWANSAFATVVLSGFYPIFFKQFWSAGVAASESTFRLGVANSVSSLIVVLMAPILGAIADRVGGRKRFLAAFAALGALSTGSLFLVGQGQWWVASLAFVIGVLGFAGANVFYDALLIAVSGEDNRERVSALGFSLGYLGGGVLFAINVLMTLNPDWFGLADAAEAVRWSFLSVSIWWLVFTIPLLVWVPEPAALADRTRGHWMRDSFRELLQTIRDLRAHRNLVRFLIAYWLYIDAVDTIIRMAVDFGLSVGLDSGDLIKALLMTQFIGFPAALVFGLIGQRLGAKAGILIALSVYILVTLYAVFLDTAQEFFVLAAVIGLVQGGVQALSRSLYSRLIPPERSAEFFGFYNMLGKFAAVLGPVLVGAVTLMTGSGGLGLMSLLILLVSGALLLRGVTVPDRRSA
jgi:UMF1 family MFS transporter